jgi:hypothetical protein
VTQTQPTDAAASAAAEQQHHKLELLVAALYLAALREQRGEGDAGSVDAAADKLELAIKLGVAAAIVHGIRKHRKASRLAQAQLEAAITPSASSANAEAMAQEARTWAEDAVKIERAAPSNEADDARRKSDGAAELRARTVATREAAQRASAAADGLGEDMGIGKGALQKVWVSRGDSKVRELHRKLHGRVRPTGEPFYSWLATDQQLRFPGDPDAPLDATMGCRCVLWFAWGAEAGAVEKALTPPSLTESFPAA